MIDPAKLDAAAWARLLDAAPAELLAGAYGRRIRPRAPRQKVLIPCAGCRAPLSARERRKPCPHCGARNPR